MWFYSLLTEPCLSYTTTSRERIVGITKWAFPLKQGISVLDLGELNTNPFNWSKNTSWIKTQVIRTKKLEMTTPGADGLMAWASNGIPPPKYNYMQNPTWRNTEDLTLNYRRQNVQNWGSEVTRHVLPWLEDALELFSPPGAGDVCNLNHKVQEKWGQKKHIGHFSAMSLLSAEGNLLTLWNMFRNKVFWFRK